MERPVGAARANAFHANRAQRRPGRALLLSFF